jgi:hypothetical protein
VTKAPVDVHYGVDGSRTLRQGDSTITVPADRVEQVVGLLYAVPTQWPPRRMPAGRTASSSWPLPPQHGRETD